MGEGERLERERRRRLQMRTSCKRVDCPASTAIQKVSLKRKDCCQVVVKRMNEAKRNAETFSSVPNSSSNSTMNWRHEHKLKESDIPLRTLYHYTWSPPVPRCSGTCSPRNRYLERVARVADSRRPRVISEFRAAVITAGALVGNETAAEIERWKQDLGRLFLTGR